MRGMCLCLLLGACGPVAGTGDAGSLPDAAEASAPLDAPGDAPLEAGAPEAAGPDVVAEVSAPDARTCATDMDGDGHIARSCGGDDCDDMNPHAHPGERPACGLVVVDGASPDLNCDENADFAAGGRDERCAVEAPAAMRQLYPTGPMATEPPACIMLVTSPAAQACVACSPPGATQQCACWRSNGATVQPYRCRADGVRR